MVFVREVLERCVRLSYYDRIKATLPPSFKEVSTVFWETAPRPNFKYEQPTPNGEFDGPGFLCAQGTRIIDDWLRPDYPHV